MPVYRMKIDAKTPWVDTGLTLDGTATVTVRVLQGQWTANPANGLVTADGHPGLVAKPGYSLPGELEGLLVGRVDVAGQPSVFPIGTSGTVPANLAGPLYLSNNDDVNGIYGAGFTDNEGAMEVEIEVGSLDPIGRSV